MEGGSLVVRVSLSLANESATHRSRRWTTTRYQLELPMVADDNSSDDDDDDDDGQWGNPMIKRSTIKFLLHWHCNKCVHIFQTAAVDFWFRIASFPTDAENVSTCLSHQKRSLKSNCQCRNSSQTVVQGEKNSYLVFARFAQCLFMKSVAKCSNLAFLLILMKFLINF